MTENCRSQQLQITIVKPVLRYVAAVRPKVDIIPPPDTGRLDPGAISAALRRERHMQQLSNELSGGEWAVRVRPRRTSISGGTVVLAGIAAALTFALVLGLSMWRDGSLQRLLPRYGFDFAPKPPAGGRIAGRTKADGAHQPANEPKPQAGTPMTHPAAEPVDAKQEYDEAHPASGTGDATE